MGDTRVDNLSAKEHAFCDYYFETRDPSLSAIRAGYPEKSADPAGVMVLRRKRVKAYLSKLWEEAASPIVMSVRERLEILSQMGRANIADYIDDKGCIDLKNIKNSLAVREVTVLDRYDKFGNLNRTTRIKLHNPVEPIDLINKMEKVYRITDQSGPTSVVNNYYVTDARVVDMIKKIGERTVPAIELTGRKVEPVDDGG